MTAGDAYWRTYYREVFEQRRSWLDYSNERVQAQTFGLVLEAAGPVNGRRCVDIGCGWGQLARTLHDLGAASVTGVDLVPEHIAQLSREIPHIRWLCGDLSAGELGLEPGSCEILLMVEVLQYMPFAATLARAWDLLAPGGRIVAVVPNASCPIVASTRERFGGRYAPPTLQDARTVLPALRDVQTWSYRGLTFAADQRIAPYEVTAWTQAEPAGPVPNRIQLTALKA